MNVIVYGADWCKDCKKAYDTLDRWGIPYSTISIDTADDIILKEANIAVIPTIEITDDHNVLFRIEDAPTEKEAQEMFNIISK